MSHISVHLCSSETLRSCRTSLHRSRYSMHGRANDTGIKSIYVFTVDDLEDIGETLDLEGSRRWSQRAGNTARTDRKAEPSSWLTRMAQNKQRQCDTNDMEPQTSDNQVMKETDLISDKSG
jgi:hypothetical protein